MFRIGGAGYAAFLVTTAIGLLAVACGAPADGPTTRTPQPPARIQATATPAPLAIQATPTVRQVAQPTINAWRTLFERQLTDVVTGETFTLGDLAGKILVIELMATWCPPCLEQQAEMSKAKAQVGDRAVFISVVIDYRESAASLREYQTEVGWDWTLVPYNAEFIDDLTRITGPLMHDLSRTPFFYSYSEGISPPRPGGHRASQHNRQAD